jgi:RNA polymerase primary sigma factor
MVVPSDQVEQRERTEVVEKALDTLPERERKVLWARLWEGRSRGDIGREFGVLAGRIRQIEGRAIRRLRRPAVVQLLNTVHGEA